MGSVLYMLSNAERELVRKTETNLGILIYHVIKNKTNADTLYATLSASAYEDERKADRATLMDIDTEHVFWHMFRTQDM